MTDPTDKTPSEPETLPSPDYVDPESRSLAERGFRRDNRTPAPVEQRHWELAGDLLLRYANHPEGARDLVAQALADERAQGEQEGRRLEAIEREKCTTCGGDPHSHPSGILCICGDGTRTSETVNLRWELEKVLRERKEGRREERARRERAEELIPCTCRETRPSGGHFETCPIYAEAAKTIASRRKACSCPHLTQEWIGLKAGRHHNRDCALWSDRMPQRDDADDRERDGGKEY